jgi:hypothetical protein
MSYLHPPVARRRIDAAVSHSSQNRSFHDERRGGDALGVEHAQALPRAEAPRIAVLAAEPAPQVFDGPCWRCRTGPAAVGRLADMPLVLGDEGGRQPLSRLETPSARPVISGQSQSKCPRSLQPTQRAQEASSGAPRVRDAAGRARCSASCPARARHPGSTRSRGRPDGAHARRPPGAPGSTLRRTDRLRPRCPRGMAPQPRPATAALLGRVQPRDEGGRW